MRAIEIQDTHRMYNTAGKKNPLTNIAGHWFLLSLRSETMFFKYLNNGQRQGSTVQVICHQASWLKFSP